MHPTRPTEKSYVDIFARDVTVYNTGDDDLTDIRQNKPTNQSHNQAEGTWVTNRWKSNTIRNLLHDMTGGTESGRFDAGSEVAVADDTGDEVQDGIGDLEHSQGSGEVFWLFHFRNEAEEGNVGDCKGGK